MNPINDVRLFMLASGAMLPKTPGLNTELHGKVRDLDQTVVKLDRAYGTFLTSPAADNLAIVAEEACNTAYKAFEILHNLGLDPFLVWSEVHQSKMRMIDSSTLAVNKRFDGTVSPPTDWVPPDILSIVLQSGKQRT